MGLLTYSNYNGPAMHESAAGKSRQYPSAGGIPLRESRRNGIMATKSGPAITKRAKSIEIDAEPLSTGDEEDGEEAVEDEKKKSLEPSPRSKRMLARMEQDDQKIRQTQISLNESKTALSKPQEEPKKRHVRSTRKKLVDHPLEMALVQEQEKRPEDTEELSEGERILNSWQEEPANKKRKTQKYHGSAVINIHAHASSPKREAGFQTPPELSSPPATGRNNRSGFQAPVELGSPGLARQNHFTRRSRRSKLTDQNTAFKVPGDTFLPGSVTVNNCAMPSFPPESSTSSATIGDQASTVFSHPDSPPRARSCSVSSLSSVGSIVSVLLTQDEKEKLVRVDPPTATDQDESPRERLVQCPLCLSPVSEELLVDFTTRHSKNKARLTSRLQQRFCREHQARTAAESWREQGYPEIDWTELSTTRVNKHLQHLRPILQNKTPSFYREQLITGSNPSGSGKTDRGGRGGRQPGGRRSLLKYLKEGILDVVKYGYYGPRGAKTAAEAIMTALSGDLVSAAKTDPIVRDAGAAGFVQAVLVPELLGMWVAEDRGWDWSQQRCRDNVRALLDRSSEVGRLVNEDEDRVNLGSSLN